MPCEKIKIKFTIFKAATFAANCNSSNHPPYIIINYNDQNYNHIVRDDGIPIFKKIHQFLKVFLSGKNHASWQQLVKWIYNEINTQFYIHVIIEAIAIPYNYKLKQITNKYHQNQWIADVVKLTFIGKLYKFCARTYYLVI